MLAQSLTATGWSLATAESCTGGWIAKCCTDRAGSSAWFERGFVTYSNAGQAELLGVDRTCWRLRALSAEGGPADGRRRAGAGRVKVRAAVTGIAGPDGGSADKPVGTVWFGWSCKGSRATADLQCFQGDRDAVRRQTVSHALQGLIDRLHE